MTLTVSCITPGIHSPGRSQTQSSTPYAPDMRTSLRASQTEPFPTLVSSRFPFPCFMTALVCNAPGLCLRAAAQ